MRGDIMAEVTVALNSTQKLDINNGGNGNPTTIGINPFVLYVCPVGKVAKVTSFQYRATGFGSGTEMYARANGIRLSEQTTFPTVMEEVAGNGIRLTPGQSIDLAGDAVSNNASAFYTFAVQELPA